MSLLNKFSIKDFILSSKEAYQKELKNKGVGSDIGKSLFNKFSIKEIINAIWSVKINCDSPVWKNKPRCN